MNSCVRCFFETGVHTGGPFMHQGNSLCARHLAMEQPVEAEVPSDASKPIIKWEDDKVDE